MHALGGWPIAAPNKSLDEMVNQIIATLLHDVSKTHGAVFNYASLRKTLKKVQNRLSAEGIGFLTKTLPRLGKAFDKALSGSIPLNSTSLGFKPQSGSELPMFMGEFFNRVLHQDGTLLQSPCVSSVRVIRQLTYTFYKYELPYTDEQEHATLAKFERTEQELSVVTPQLDLLRKEAVSRESWLERRGGGRTVSFSKTRQLLSLVCDARTLLRAALAGFDPTAVCPRHGPGVVATRQLPWAKYLWTSVSGSIIQYYPLDAYFFASGGAVCDGWRDFDLVTTGSSSARVLLVPKDSRGPRLISCEPVDNQWIQQGISRALTAHVEHTDTTRYNVFFTDQQPNRRGAQLGSSTGRYATLDLNEASDRVSVSLVRLLFPDNLLGYLECCRSLSTVLPCGRSLPLSKFAPMGSALCFPIMALTIWALLTAGAPDRDTRESILVYGDDVIVPTAYAEDAMNILESFGLKINRDKSCTGGLFRESCGMDAFKGAEVTPVRCRTVWSESRSPDSYVSWIAYANSFYRGGYYLTYDKIVRELHRLYGRIPAKSMYLTCPSLEEVDDAWLPLRRRTNLSLQKTQWYVWDIKTPVVTVELPGWSKLLRYFTETKDPPLVFNTHDAFDRNNPGKQHLSVSQYTRRSTSMLVKRWR